MDITEGSYGGRAGKDGLDAVDTLYAQHPQQPDRGHRDALPAAHRPLRAERGHRARRRQKKRIAALVKESGKTVVEIPAGALADEGPDSRPRGRWSCVHLLSLDWPSFGRGYILEIRLIQLLSDPSIVFKTVGLASSMTTWCVSAAQSDPAPMSLSSSSGEAHKIRPHVGIGICSRLPPGSREEGKDCRPLEAACNLGLLQELFRLPITGQLEFWKPTQTGKFSSAP